MKSPITTPAFSMLSTCLLLVAATSALLSFARGSESSWSVTDWIGCVSAVALVVSLFYDARK